MVKVLWQKKQIIILVLSVTKDGKENQFLHDDDAKDECFRSYKNPLRSYKDHSLFLVERDRYSSLFKLNRKDYKSWAIGLKAAGIRH